jgi:protein TonB
MELAADISFSLRPGVVVFADSKRWQRALTFSLVLHALAGGVLLQQHLSRAPDLPLPSLTVSMQRSLHASAVAPSEAQPRIERAPQMRHSMLRPAGATAEILATADAAPFSAPAAAVAPQPSDAGQGTPAMPVADTRPAPHSEAEAVPDNAALTGYSSALAAAVDRYKSYPRIALSRQWQGTVVLQLNIGTDGRIQDYRLARSSGHEALDQQALEMLRAAMPLPSAPARLAGMDLSIDIPVTFRIAD